MADILRVNKTVTKIILLRNNILDEGSTALANSLHNIITLACLDLGYNNIGDNGAEELSESLTTNRTLIRLTLCNNNIGSKGILSFIKNILVNDTLQTLHLVGNYVEEKTAILILDAIRHNSTLICLDLFEDYCYLQREIDDITCWNSTGSLYPIEKFQMLLEPFQQRTLFILLLLDQLPISNSLHCVIFDLIKVRDVVKDEDPYTENSWS